MVGWILLGLLGVIVLALFVPVRVRVEYLEDWRACVWLFGAIPLWTLPASKKSAKSKKKGTVKKKKPSLKDELKALFDEGGVSGVLRFFAELVALLKNTLASLAPFITIRKLALCVRVGGDEADETAKRYGAISAATANGLATLSQLVRVKRPCVRVIPDFTSDKLEARLRMVVWVWPFGAVGVALAALFRLAMVWIKTKNVVK